MGSVHGAGQLSEPVGVMERVSGEEHQGGLGERPLDGREAVLLVNTRSLKGTEWLDQAKAKLVDAGINLTLAQGCSKAADLFRQASREAGEGKLVIVGGGDGTMSAVANILAKTGSTMGVLPLGTGNAFARDLGIPTDLDKAVEILVSGMPTEVDLGVCDGKYFVNVVTIGLTTTVAKTLTVPLKRRFGRFVYGIALYKALRKTKPFLARIETEHGVTEINTIELVIGNGRYHAGPLPLSPTAAITSGLLRLYAVEAGSNAGLIKYALLLPTGLQGILKTVHSEATVGGTVTATPIQSVVVDGEVSHKTPITFSVEPLVLRVMVPKSFKG
ncbi:MAG: YegS/Rv2252/BmrU family lipid kinase [Fimbriimonadaceae bacterium]